VKEVEFFAFMMPPSIWCKKPHPSSYKMTIEDAAKRFPGAEPILSSREVRLGGDGVIRADAPYQRGSRTKTADEERLSEWLVSRIGEKSKSVRPEPDPPVAPRDNEP